MQRCLQRVLTNLKEQSSVSYAKIATIGGFCDLDHIVVKATSPDDIPLPDKYVHQLLKIFSISPSSSSFRSFSLSFTRRFGNTRCWRVALKCLLLLHRLLRSLPQNSPFRAEFLWARSNGFVSLYPCNFRDISSSSDSEDYTLFIRAYAQLLDEALQCFSFEIMEQTISNDVETLPEKMKEIRRMVEVLPQLQSLIDRVMGCRPTGAAAKSFVVKSTMKYIIRDSFGCYATFRREIGVLLDHLIQIPYRSCIATFAIYKKAGLQADQLVEFYDWCKSLGLCGSYEYPSIDQIPKIQIQALESFLNGMWQLTDSSSSSSSSTSSSLMQSPEIDQSSNPKRLEGQGETEPLIELEVESKNNNNNNNVSWETLLEASINTSCIVSGNCLSHYNTNNEVNKWQIQLYNPHTTNPFDQQPHIMMLPCYHHHESWVSSNPNYPWGL